MTYGLAIPELAAHRGNQAEIIFTGASIADAQEMALVLERANARRGSDNQPLPSYVTDIDKFEEIEERLTRPGAWAYAARHAGKVVGFVLGHPSSEEQTIPTNSEVEYLALLMSEPEYWGRGIGRTLLSMAYATAQAKGRKHMVLWTMENNERGRGLYEDKGYQLTNETRTSERRGSLVQYEIHL